jgi:BlaR1 peptidase M56
MNARLPSNSLQLWHIAGWTMVHFMWLGALVALAAATCRVLLRRSSPNARYAVATASLALLATLPLSIAALWSQHPRTNVQPEPGVAADGSAIRLTRAGTANDVEIERYNSDVALPSQAAPTAPHFAGGLPANRVQKIDGFDHRQSRSLPGAFHQLRSTSTTSWLDACVGYLPWIWLMGTPLTFAFLATGIVGTERLRRASRPIVEGPVAEICARLTTSLRVGSRITIAICERVYAPVLIGILRPMILLPPSALSGWSPDEIEMVLLHELAHVRRWDNLVNLVQRLVESLLFFHPAVWIVSNWMRRERESCCDAIVVSHSNRRQAYAALLVTIASQQREAGRARSPLFPARPHPRRRCPGSLTSAMASGPLRNRIRQILQLEDDPMLVTGKTFALALVGLLVTSAFCLLYLPTMTVADELTAGTTQAGEEAAEAVDSVDEQSVDGVRLDSFDGQSVGSAQADRVKAHNQPGQEGSAESPAGSGTDEDQPESPEGRVLGTFPHPSPHDFGRLFHAADDARAQNLNVDIVSNNDKVDLVVVPQQTEADWPAMLGDPPRKERVIAEKAWQRLGLKLAPVSQLEMLESQYTGKGGQIKIMGGNVPAGLPLPAFVRGIANIDQPDFDGLHAWLSDSGTRTSDPVRVYATSGGNEYLLEVRAIAATKANDLGSPPSARPAPKFPSLEDQRLADLAWRMLQLELEPIGEQDRQRVSSLGYSGGVNVTGTMPSEGRQLNYYEIQRGDILVGLHVWPTTSLKAVAEILTRDDLADLNPLKFYVIRREPTNAEKAMIVTGRIPVRSQPAQPELSDVSSQTAAAEAVVEMRPATPTDRKPDPTSPLDKRRNSGVTTTGESQEALDEFMGLAASPRSAESLGVLKKMVEREKQKYDRMAELAQHNAVSAAEVATQKADYEISMERFRQATRALQYHKLSVDSAKADYEAALEASKNAPGAVPEAELRRLKLRVQLAEAKFQELAQ